MEERARRKFDTFNPIAFRSKPDSGSVVYFVKVGVDACMHACVSLSLSLALALALSCVHASRLSLSLRVLVSRWRAPHRIAIVAATDLFPPPPGASTAWQVDVGAGEFLHVKFERSLLKDTSKFHGFQESFTRDGIIHEF